MSVRARPGAAPVVGYRTGCVGMQDASSGAQNRREWFEQDTLSLRTAVNRARKYNEFQPGGRHRDIFNRAAVVLRSQESGQTGAVTDESVKLMADLSSFKKVSF